MTCSCKKTFPESTRLVCITEEQHRQGGSTGGQGPVPATTRSQCIQHPIAAGIQDSPIRCCHWRRSKVCPSINLVHHLSEWSIPAHTAFTMTLGAAFPAACIYPGVCHFMAISHNLFHACRGKSGQRRQNSPPLRAETDR